MKKQAKVGITPFNTFVLTSMSLLVSAGPALANGGHGRVHTGFGGPERGANRAERLAGQERVERVRNADVQVDQLVNDRIADRIADRINARQNRHLDQVTQSLNTQAAQANVKAQTLGLSTSTLGEPSLNRRGFELDLSSDKQSVVLGSRLFGHEDSVTIKVGGADKTFTPGMAATAGEYVAIQEVLGGSSQSISLNGSGVANGGNFSLNEAVSRKVSSLVIPEQVSAVGQFAKKTFEINGDLVNHGTIFGYSTRSNRGEISILADGIVNTSTGRISTEVPNALLGGDVSTATSLALTAQNDLNNAGAISSSDSLTLTSVHGDVTNSAGASVKAAGSINISAGSGKLNNAGLIASSGADVNLNAPVGIGLDIQGVGGTIQALGNINVRDCALSGDVNMVGGDYLSNALNIRTGSGALTGSVGKVTGTLNTSGYAAHFTADTENLLLGDNIQEGDPTWANTGNISITGTVTANEDITIVAGGNITAAGGALISTANSVIPSGGSYKPSSNITIIAGAQVSTSGSTTTTVPGTAITTGTASVDFSLGGGGNVDLTGVTIDSSSDLTVVPPPGNNEFWQENGGNVRIIAYANGATGGVVTTGLIDTSSQYGKGGDVTIIAGRNPGAAQTTVTVNDINTSGGGGSLSSFASGGNVTIVTAQPGLDSGSVITFLPDGSQSSKGHIVPVGPVSALANVQIASITTGGGGSGLTLGDVGGSVLIRAGSFNMGLGEQINTSAKQVGGNVRIETVGALNTNSGDIRTFTLGQSGSDGQNGGNIYLSGSSVSAAQLLTANSTTRFGGSVAVRATGTSVTTGLIDARGDGTSGDVVIDAASDLTVTSLSSTGAIRGNNIVLGSGNNLSVTASGGASTVNLLSTGSILLAAGNSGNAATINVTGGIQTAEPTPGFIEIVNNAATTGATNVTVGGAIDASSNAVNGEGGAVTVVSSGRIALGNISSTSLVGTIAAQSKGGSIFISSGGTGANAITVGTINTSAIAVAGNIILLSSGASTVADPTNITHGAFTQTGVNPGGSLSASLSGASATIPTQLNINLTLTGPGAINIRPGGYQTQQGTLGTPIDVTINNLDERFLVPINISAAGNSLFLGTLSQTSGNDSFSIITGGMATFTQDLNTGSDTGNVAIMTRGGFVSEGVSVGLGSKRALVLASMQNGFTVDQFRGTAYDSVVVAGAIDASNNSGVGSTVAFSSEISSVYTNDIRTFGTGAVGPASVGGGVSLSANNNIVTGNIDTSSYAGPNIFNDAGAGNVSLLSNGVIATGDLTSAGNGRIFIDSDIDPSSTGSSVTTGNIVTLFTATSPQTSVSINVGGSGAVVTGNISTASKTGGSAGGVSIAGGQTGVLTGDIDTSSLGLFGGDVHIIANGDIRVSSIDATTSGSAENGGGGSVEIVAVNARGISWGPRGIDTRANYAGASDGDGGRVSLTGHYISGYDILTGSTNLGGSGDGGDVSINAASFLFMRNINTVSNNTGAISGKGGDVVIAGGNDSNIGLNTRFINTVGSSQGGDVSEYSSSFIVAQGINTSSSEKGGDVRLIGQSFVTTFNIDASATNGSAVDVEGGSVEIVASTSVIFINNNINTFASSQGGDAIAGSVGLVAFNGSGLSLFTGGINASASTILTGNAIAGDIYAASSQNIANSLQMGVLNTAATGGTTNRNGESFLGVRGGNAGSISFTNGGGNAPVLFFNSGSQSITGPNATLTVTPGLVTIIPGIYNTIGTQANPVNLTLNFGGDSRLLVPLVTNSTLSGEGIFVSGVHGDNLTAGGTFAYENNGYDVHLHGFGLSLASGQPGNRISGNITANPVIGGTAGDIEIFAFNGIDQTSGTISGNSLVLTTLGSANITSANPITTDVPTMTARTFNVSSVPAARNLFVRNTRNGLVNIVGVNGVTGINGSTFRLEGGTTTNFQLLSGGSISGSTIELLTGGVGNTFNVNGAVSGNTTVATIEMQAATVSLASTGSIRATKVLLETANLANSGTIEATQGTLAIDNSAAGFPANLSLSGSGNLFSNKAVSLSTTGSIDFGSLIQAGVLAVNPGQSLIMVAGGNISATGGNTNFSVTSGGSAGDAGSLIMMAGVLYSIGATSFNDIVLPQGPVASATGGSIILDGSNSGYILNTIDLTSKTGNGGQLTMFAQGPSGGDRRILLPLGGTVETGGLSSNGDVLMYALGPAAGTGNAIQVGDINIGGNLANYSSIDLEVGIVNAAAPIPVTGALTALPDIDEGGNGAITTGDLRTNKGFVYVYADDDVNVSFTNATLKASIIEFSSINGNIDLPVNYISAVPLIDGSGGAIFVGGQSVTWLGMGIASLTLNADANLGTIGEGGSAQFETKSLSPLTIGGAAGNVQVSALSNTVGGIANISTGGTLIVDLSFLDINPLGANASGGGLVLQGNSIVSSVPGQALTIDLSGVGTGDGGKIVITQTGNAPAFVGTNNAPGVFRLIANSGASGTQAGDILFRSFGDLTVDPAGISNQVLGANGNGGILELLAGGPSNVGRLTINGQVNANGKGAGVGGTIFLSSNDPVNTMTAGGKSQPANGVAGWPTATGSVSGTIRLTNFGGDVTALSTPKSGLRGITLATAGTGDVIVPSKFGSSSLDIILRADGTGNVIGASSKSTVTADELVLIAAGGNVGASAAPLLIGARLVEARGVNVDISAKKDLNLTAGNSASGTYTATAANIYSSFTINAPNLILTAKGTVAANDGGDTPIDINSTNVTVNAGTAVLNNTGTNPITLSSTSSKAKVLVLTSETDINVNTAIGGKKTVILLNSQGDINTSGSGLISADDLQLLALGGIGTTSTLQVSAATLSADSQQGVDINDVAASITLKSISAANGDIDITTGTATKSLETLGATSSTFGSLITAINGHITLQNNNASKGTIKIGAGSNITTGGVGGGDVSILIGGTTSVAGPVPVGVEFTNNGSVITPPLPGGTFFFGTNGITVSGTSAATPTIQMNVLGGKSVIFNTGAQSAKAITVVGGTAAEKTIITADPPITATATPAASASASSADMVMSQFSLPGTSVPAAPAAVPADHSVVPAANGENKMSVLPSFDSMLSNSQSLSNTLSMVSSAMPSATTSTMNLIPTTSAALATDVMGNGFGASSLLSSAASALSAFGTQTQEGWMSETELSSGHVPGIVYSDADLSIKADVSTVIDFTRSESAAHKLAKGAVLFAPTVDTNVQTPHGNIRIDADSVVFVMSFKDGVAVFDIDDAHKNAVSVSVADREVRLAPGSHVLLTRDSVRTMDDINPAQFIGHRNVKEHTFNNGGKMFSSEFSIPNAISAVMPVKQLLASKHPHTKQLANHMMKTVAIHMHLNQNANDYKQLVRPSTTAYVQN